MNSLDPVQRVSDQIGDGDQAARARHRSQAARGAQSKELFGYVGISPGRARQYPHEFSGGMRQRVMIALALACNPELIIGDEPTTALDVMMQAQILELLESLRREFGLSMILITHDLSVLAETCDKVAIMYGGQIAETGADPRRLPRAAAPVHAPAAGRVPRRSAARASWRPPSPACRPTRPAIPPGCRFAPRCHVAKDECAARSRTWTCARCEPGREARCLFAPWEGGAPNEHPAALRGAEEPVATDPAPGVAHGAPLFQVPDLKVHFPIRGTKNGGEGARRRRPRVAPRRGARHRRRVGLRQVDARPRAAWGCSRRRRARSCSRASRCDRAACAKLRRRVQMIFQDPYQSLNPRMNVGDARAGGARRSTRSASAATSASPAPSRRSRAPGSAGRSGSGTGTRTSCPAASASAW